jgi:hypothetical protein
MTRVQLGRRADALTSPSADPVDGFVTSMTPGIAVAAQHGCSRTSAKYGSKGRFALSWSRRPRLFPRAGMSVASLIAVVVAEPSAQHGNEEVV